MTTSLERAKPSIMAAFDTSKRVFSTREVYRLIEENRPAWNLAERTKPAEVLQMLTNEGFLQEQVLRARNYPPITRYVWREPSPLTLAARIWNRAYLSHATAVFMHALTADIPKTIYVNREQTPKRSSDVPLNQERIDMAFSRNQRVTSYLISFGAFRIALISGKHTGSLEVTEMREPLGDATVPVTKLERTLIDISVRPEYAGGVAQVIEAYRGAADRLRLVVLVATLKKLAFLYPYHQAIGFYLKRAGFPPEALAPLRELGLNYNFYAAHGMTLKEYDADWRLFFPKGL